MKKLILFVILGLSAAVLASCAAGKEKTSDRETTAAAETVSDTADDAADDAEEGGYEMREIWCENNGSRIYGVAYIPKSKDQTRFPLVIHAHGMGSNHEAGAAYGKRYAEQGYAAYTFDFPGGSRPSTENRSDGDPMEMSALTEAADLQAILDTALTWDFVDPDNVFLEGGSMGGLIATMIGLDNPDKVKGLILHYPALYMPQVVTQYYNSPEDVPDTVSFGDDYELSGKFVRDLWGLDVISRLGEFPGSVTIIQGSEDPLVPAYTIEEVSGLFQSAEFHLIEGAGHGFSGDDFEAAVQYGLDYLKENT